MSGKGKEKVTDKGKRKWSEDDDKAAGGKRKTRGVLQFFDDAAYQVDDDNFSSDDSMFDAQDYAEDDYASELKSKDEPRKVPDLQFVPKEEEMSEEEIERILEQRYKPGAGFVTYAEDGYENKRSVGGDTYAPSAKDPAIWKVKCTVGRERYSAFCLMQKYVEMELLRTKLPIISAFSPDYVKGYIFIEADKQNDVYDACKGINTIYASKVTLIPSKDFSRLLSVRNKSSGISKDMWARVKNGTYKGDLALVAAVNDERKKVTVKLIPRIDLKAMAQKFGGGVASKRIIPPQRLISPSELDEFRPLIHCRRDRDTNEMFEILDGIMLKDGYVYKKVSIDSLSFWGVVPTEDELLKFEPAKKDDATDVQWLSQLFGEKKKGQIEKFKPDKGSGKSEGSTSSSMGNNFEVHDLVFFGRKDFGVVIGLEKDDSVKIVKEGSDGSSIVTVKQSDLKRASFDKKLFSVSDQHSNIISINDIVRILDGPLKDREGVVKKIYKGILFLCDGSVQENNGYVSVKAQLCEKVNLSGKESHEKGGGESGPSGFADMLSPKSPLCPEKSYPERDNESSFQREEDGMFSVGQSLRIRVGPLKGYRCKVLAIRRTDVTVKLDSQQKILTVKSEHLSEVRGRNSAFSQGEESGSMKPFGFLASEDGASDWTSEAALPNEASNWNAVGSAQRTSAVESSNSWLPKPPGSADRVDNSATEGTGWQIKASEESSSWGAATAEAKQDNVPEPAWGTSNGWNQNASSKADTIKDNSWGAAANKWGSGGDASGSKSENCTAEASWGKQMETQSEGNADNASKSWDTKTTTEGAVSGSQWNTESDKPAWSKQDSGSSWGKPAEKSDVEKETGKNDGWGSTKSNRDNSVSGWNVSKGSENIKSSGWGEASSGNGESGNDGGNWSTGGNWKSASEGKTSDWNSGGKKGDSGSWKDGGSSTGWGQTNWGGSGPSDAGGNRESAWSSKSNWTVGGGDRGGRSDRGGFQGGRGGSGCFKCGEEGHMSRECPQGGGGGGRGGSGCFKCGEEGHMSRECPQGGGGGGRGGSGCFKCGEEGHMSRECPQGGGRGGSGCFKCGEEGHMSRECPQGGGGGGRGGSGCFKCGEQGHMSRECPQGGGGGGKGGSVCFKCGEEGHMSRECPQGRGGGGRGGSGCFKCGEEGHMARDCTQGGGGGGGYGSGAGGRSGGGGNCYKCGEGGHFARECPTA